MELEAFKQMALLLKKESERSDKPYRLGIDTINFSDELHQIITLLLRVHYSKDGEEIINWWLWEDSEKILYNCSDGEKNDLTRIEDLWEHVENIRKSPNFIEYIPEKNKRKSKKQLQKMFKQMLQK